METLLVATSNAATIYCRHWRKAYAKRRAWSCGAVPVTLTSPARYRSGQPGGLAREEYLAPVLAVRVVERPRTRRSTHIETYGSQHTDSIVTREHARAMRFLREVDSSSVMVNASTRLPMGSSTDWVPRSGFLPISCMRGARWTGGPYQREVRGARGRAVAHLSAGDASFEASRVFSAVRLTRCISVTCARRWSW